MKIGVGLIVIANKTNRILTVRELFAKPIIMKEAGMVSFPIETVKKGEEFADTITRLMEEEMGIIMKEKFKFFCEPFMLIPNTQTLAAYMRVEDEFDIYPDDHRVEYSGWYSTEDLMSDEFFTRVETRPILKKLLCHCDGGVT
ncbi:MAG: NUDIX domain-containing protein [Patescibacteria group bacterium]